MEKVFKTVGLIEWKKVWAMLASVCVMGVGVAVLEFTQAGPDPAAALNYGVSGLLGISFGTYQLLFNIILFFPLFRYSKKLFGLGTIGNMVVVGYVADFTTFVIEKVPGLQKDMPGAVRFGIMLPALAVFVIAVAVYLNSGTGMSPYDALPFVVHDMIMKKTGKEFPFRVVRMCYDGIVTLCALFVGGRLGVVTVCMVFLLGPAVDLVGKWMKEKRLLLS